MGLFNRTPTDPAADPTAIVAEALAQSDATIELLQERLAELELQLEDEGWQRLGLDGQREFSRRGLARIMAMSRLMYLKNPLIQRAVNVKSYYVFGQGMHVQARNDQVNEVIQRFFDDQGNRDELTGHMARMQKEIDLETDGNVFLVLFPNRRTGHVRVRSIHSDEISDILCNPDDRRERQFYLRCWTPVEQSRFAGEVAMGERKVLYPDWRYRPKNRPPVVNGLQVMWDAPVYHVRVGGTGGMRFGVPETYSSLDWARAYKDFLEDWATLVRSLSRFAWRMTTKGRKVQSAAQKLGTTLDLDNAETNPPSTAGAAFVAAEGTEMTPIPKTGATTSAEDGKHLRLMVASAMDIPDTILSGDVDQGNLATAKTLDRPTELAMRTRQTLWADVFSDLCRFVVRSHLVATGGRLAGSVAVDADGIETMMLAGDNDPDALTVDVSFPEILEHDIAGKVEAIVMAATLDGKTNAGTIDNRTLVRLLLIALDVDDVDELVDDIAGELDAQQAAAAMATGPQADAVAEALAEVRDAARQLQLELAD